MNHGGAWKRAECPGADRTGMKPAYTAFETFDRQLFTRYERAKLETTRRFLEMQILVEAREFAAEHGNEQD